MIDMKHLSHACLVNFLTSQCLLSPWPDWAVTNATAWVQRHLEAEAAGKVTKPFFLIVSLWNPHDSPIAFPGQPANSTDPLTYNTTYKPKWDQGMYE